MPLFADFSRYCYGISVRTLRNKMSPQRRWADDSAIIIRSIIAYSYLLNDSIGRII